MTTTGVRSLPEGTVETQAADVDSAIADALTQLGVTREEAVIEVLAEPAAAVPGESIMQSGARVRVTRIDEHTARARDLLGELLGRMNIEARVTLRRAGGSTREDAPLPPMILDVSGDDLGLLIGWRGETLRALQTVLNLMMGDDVAAAEGENRRVIIDVERYRARREDQVRELALRLAARVKRSGERYTLDPMHAYERRIVHIALENDPGVRTESSGKEPARRIIIHATGPAEGGGFAGGGGARRRWRDR